MAENNRRTLEEINDILHLAKLTDNDMASVSQAIFFAEKDLGKYKFLELDSTLLKELQNGQTLSIKGDDDENVVLCTNNRTYDVTAGETSNSLLLVNSLQFFDDVKDQPERSVKITRVHGIHYEFLAVASSKPHLKKLMSLLDKTVYKGPEHESEINQDDLYSIEDLCQIIQSSNVELKSEINDLGVVTVNNKIRLLDVEYHFRVLTYMLKLIEENSWSLDEIDFEVTLSSLEDLVPAQILNSLFDKYAEESQIIDGLQLYRYKELEVCKFFGQIILYGAGKFNLEEFLQAWAESVPEGMITDEEYLNGIAIIDRSCTPNIIRAFPEADLPEDIQARFKVLFRVKEKWTVAEIRPYVKRLATDKMDVNALLAKFARASKVNGVKCYSAKHAK